MPRKDAAQLESLAPPVADAGKKYWRSLEELAGGEEFRRWLGREFPEQASQWSDLPSRRRFLRLMAASFALAGLQGCRSQPQEKLVPYVEAPEQLVPGVPLYYASAMPFAGEAVGVLVESHTGRPTMVEGNPRHPACGNPNRQDPQRRPISAPAGIFAQGSLLTLYDPDRSQTVLRDGLISTWGEFVAHLRPRLDAARANGGRGLRILTETVASPTLAWQLEAILKQFPQAQWHQWEPIHRDHELAGAQLAFGRGVDAVCRFDRADVVLSLDGDFLGGGLPRNLRYARDFSHRRRGDREILSRGMNRLYAVESSLTMTGAKADHRLPVRPAEVEGFARALAGRLGVSGIAETALPASIPAAWVDALVEDLRNYPQRDAESGPLIVAGATQSPAVHALVHAMNAALGAVGRTVHYIEPVAARPSAQVEQLASLVQALNAGEVELLIILGGNPVFTAPADLRFGDAIARAPFRVHTSLYVDETSAACPWHVPETHWLEAWSDARAFDGTASIVQPLIRPLYDGVSPHTLLAALLGNPAADAYDVVRDYWRERLGADDANGGFEAAWRRAVHDGVIPGTQSPEVSVALAEGWTGNLPAPQEVGGGSSREIEVVFRPAPTIWDGRFANNGWLQELPKPLLKLTWDNAALLSPRTAEQLGLKTEDVVQVAAQLAGEEQRVRVPVFVVPGHPDGVATLYLGYGRTRVGRVGVGVGADVYPLRGSAGQWSVAATLRGTNQRRELALTQHHFSMEGRPLVLSGTFAEWEGHPEHPAFMDVHHHGELTSLFGDEWKYDGHKWGMAIDLTACIGCSACVLGCQAENNIPVVGKSQVAIGREMHWIRVDHYFEGAPENPATHHMPVPCMHCEMAPCEPVCPVAATVHGPEGLNEMAYNRCVGTRYCSNNCPYKVRRFNFLQYSDTTTPVLKLLRNPDVTVRNRGVMEKCTYCVQRISAARIEIEKRRLDEGNPDLPLADGAVVTACQAACPTEAIVFGDLNDPNSRVARLKQEPTEYTLLEELNTRPRTTYLAGVRNPNPKLAGPA